MPAVSDQSENDCLKYCRHSNCQAASIRIFLFLPFENIYVLQRTPKFTYRPLFSANPKSHPPANQLLLD